MRINRLPGWGARCLFFCAFPRRSGWGVFLEPASVIGPCPESTARGGCRGGALWLMLLCRTWRLQLILSIRSPDLWVLSREDVPWWVVGPLSGGSDVWSGEKARPPQLCDCSSGSLSFVTMTIHQSTQFKMKINWINICELNDSLI